MPKSKHHRKRRAGTKKRGRRGGLAYSSRASPSLSEVQLSKSIKPVSPPPMKPVSPPMRPVSRPPMKSVSPPMRPVSPPSMKPVSRPPMKPVSTPSLPSNKSFKNTMQGHMNTAKNVVQKGITGALSGLSNLMGKASRATSGGRKSRHRRTHKRRRSSRGFKKGTKSKTHRGRKNFTTKRGNKVFHRRGHYVRLNRAPYRKKK